MQINAIDSGNFTGKNNFLLRAKNANDINQKKYWTSLHYEAVSRLYGRKSRNTRSLLSFIQDTGSAYGGLIMLGIAAKMGLERLKSDIYGAKAYNTFSNRFAEPDDFRSSEERHYKIKESYL